MFQLYYNFLFKNINAIKSVVINYLNFIIEKLNLFSINIHLNCI